MRYLDIYYYENFRGEWDSYSEGKQLVKLAKNIAQAKVFTEVLLSEEYEQYIIARETLCYHIHTGGL